MSRCTGCFFLLVRPKNDQVPDPQNILTFLWDLKCNLTLSHFQGGPVTKNTLYVLLTERQCGLGLYQNYNFSAAKLISSSCLHLQTKLVGQSAEQYIDIGFSLTFLISCFSFSHLPFFIVSFFFSHCQILSRS